MNLSLTKQNLETIIYKTTGVMPDEIALLEAIAPHCDPKDIKNAKVLFLAGCGREYRVNGVTFEERQDILKRMSTGNVLEFEPEPDNPHDENAIKVMWKDEHVGYLPRKQAMVVQDCIVELCGEVVAIVGDTEEGEQEKNLGIRFVFRRKESVSKKQIVNLDTVDLLCSELLDTQQETVARAQMMTVLEEAQKPKKKKIEEVPMLDTEDLVIVSPPLMKAVIEATPPTPFSVLPPDNISLPKEKVLLPKNKSVPPIEPVSKKSPPVEINKDGDPEEEIF